MIILNVFVSLKPEQESTFLSDTEPLIEKSRAEEGNSLYNLYRQTDQAQRYVIVEHWQDQTALDTHNATAHFQAFAAKIDQYCTAALDIQRYDV